MPPSQSAFYVGPDVRLIPAGDGSGEGVVLQFAPLRALKLNAAAFGLLQQCRRGYRPNEAAHAGKDAAFQRMMAFLDRFCQARILEWKPALNTYKPFVSIVIAVYNRRETLRTCLESLENLNYTASRREVIVVDDASTDGSAAVAQDFGARLIVQARNQGQAAARNRGAQNARGDIIAFIDSDCLADPQWLAELTPYFQEGRYALVGGRVDAVYHQTTLDRYEAVHSALNMGDEPLIGAGSAAAFYVPACNMLVDRNLYLQHGGFTESLRVGEDVDFCWRLMQAGERLLYVPAGPVRHKHRNQFWSCFARRFDYGASEPLLYVRHPGTTRRFPWQAGGMFFVVLCLAGLLTLNLYFPAVALLAAVAEASVKVRQLQTNFGVRLSFRLILRGVLRSHLLLLYYLTGYLTRYYLGGLALLTLLLPGLINVTLPISLLPAVVAFFQKKPQLNLLLFVVYFWVEQLFYQAGVLWGCLQHKNFRLYRLTFVHAGFLSAASTTGGRLKKTFFRSS